MKPAQTPDTLVRSGLEETAVGVRTWVLVKPRPSSPSTLRPQVNSWPFEMAAEYVSPPEMLLAVHGTVAASAAVRGVAATCGSAKSKAAATTRAHHLTSFKSPSSSR